VQIREYYFNNFRTDLAAFMSGLRLPYFGHRWEHDCRDLEKISTKNRPAFIICLYFTILVDQAMHTHFRPLYDKFESLTRYPKFCHGLGSFHKNPRGILVYPIQQRLVTQESLEELLKDGMELFVDEVHDFCRDHMPKIKPEEFFNKLLYDPDVQIPLLVVIVKPELKDDIVVKAYEALKGAVKSKFPNR
jgi:hypothetical protein